MRFTKQIRHLLHLVVNDEGIELNEGTLYRTESFVLFHLQVKIRWNQISWYRKADAFSGKTA